MEKRDGQLAHLQSQVLQRFLSNVKSIFCCVNTRPRCLFSTGLGTSTSKEAKEYFSDMIRHRIPFRYSGAEDDSSIVLVCMHLKEGACMSGFNLLLQTFLCKKCCIYGLHVSFCYRYYYFM